MTYVEFHERPEHTTPVAVVSKPPGDHLKTLAKQCAGQPEDIALDETADADEQLKDERVISARTRAGHPGYR
jgi:hypothetical protein